MNLANTFLSVKHKKIAPETVSFYLEVDFIANKGNQKIYIQSALNIDDNEKRIQETNSLNRIDDSFKKIVVLKDDIEPWKDEKGIQYIGVEQFLLDDKL